MNRFKKTNEKVKPVPQRSLFERAWCCKKKLHRQAGRNFLFVGKHHKVYNTRREAHTHQNDVPWFRHLGNPIVRSHISDRSRTGFFSERPTLPFHVCSRVFCHFKVSPPLVERRLGVWLMFNLFHRYCMQFHSVCIVPCIYRVLWSINFLRNIYNKTSRLVDPFSMVQERGNIFTRPVREHIHIFSRSASGTLEARRSFVCVKKERNYIVPNFTQLSYYMR